MDEALPNGTADSLELRLHHLQSSSTNTRVDVLKKIHQDIHDASQSGGNSQEVLPYLPHLLATYPRYFERSSRKLVQSCLRAYLRQENVQNTEKIYNFIGNFLVAESQKLTVAPTSAFVLLEWCTVVLEELAKSDGFHDGPFSQTCTAAAVNLDKSLTTGVRQGLQDGAITIARRGLRKMFQSQHGEIALEHVVKHLTSSATAKSSFASYLGVVAGVSARLKQRREQFRTLVPAVLDYYVKVILGSKTLLPAQQLRGLNEVFAVYTTADSVSGTIVPALEKSILRSPENILQGPIEELAQSLPDEIDISEAVHSRLMKPLLSSLNSTNTAIRDGAGRSLSSLLARKQNLSKLDAIVQDLISNIKSAKASSFDLRGLLSDALKNLPAQTDISSIVTSGLTAAATKEANEAALRRELGALSHHLTTVLATGKLDKTTSDAVLKGCGDKRAPFKKLWLLAIGGALLNFDTVPESTDSQNFISAALDILDGVFLDLSPNPLPAAQSGIIATAMVIPALTSSPLLRSSSFKPKQKQTASQIAQTVTQPQAFLLNSKVYTKLTTPDDQRWALNALLGVSSALDEAGADGRTAWGRAILHLMLVPEVNSTIRKDSGSKLSKIYMSQPATVGNSIVLALWNLLHEDANNPHKPKADDAPIDLPFQQAISSISPPRPIWQKHGLQPPQNVLNRQAVSTVVLLGPELIPGTDWVSNCLLIGVDPGQLAGQESKALLQELLSHFKEPNITPLNKFQSAACRAAATLAFVSPDLMAPLIVEQLSSDLDASQLVDVGPTEAAIMRAPEDCLMVDPNDKSAGVLEDKNRKDYDVLKWEEELRSQLAKKKGAPSKKLTPEQKAKADAQMAYEKSVRVKMRLLSSNLRRGAGFVYALATGPPTDVRQWMSPAIDSLGAALRANAALLVETELVTAYLACADKVADRLGSLRPFIGVATLRTIESLRLPDELDTEPLSDLGTRVLYRLRFAAEQRPFDIPSLAYALPLVFSVIDIGSIGSPPSAEDADAQVLLALEFLSLQMGSCSDIFLPREKILRRLISSMQYYPQHYRLVKDALLEFSAAVSENIKPAERDVLLQAVTVPEVSARAAALQAIQSELDLQDLEYSVHIWIACQDEEEDNVDTALAIWEENELAVKEQLIEDIPVFLFNSARSTRTSAAKSLAQGLAVLPTKTTDMKAKLQTSYQQEAQPVVPKRDKFGIIQKGDLIDRWENRSGLALAFRELATVFSKDDVVSFMDFLVSDGPLCDRNATVRAEMVEAGVSIVTIRGKECLEPLMQLFEKILQGLDKATQEADWINEAVIVLYGSVARHLPTGDARLKVVLSKLVDTLNTPSESVQYAIAKCLPSLVRTAGPDADTYITSLLDQLFETKKYAARRGAAYGLAGIVKGKGISALRQFRIMSSLRASTEDKKSADRRQGSLFAYELFSLILGRVFEPYVVDVLPQLLSCFGDPNAGVREACLDTAKTCFASLSSYGVQQVLPRLLEGLDETQWRSKKGACDLLGAMAYLDPEQLATSLPDIIPPLTSVLTDTHKEVRAAANNSLKRFGEVISNPEVKSLVDILLKALSDPTKYTEDALDGLIKVSFVHYLDSPSLALIVRILERGLNDRSSTKRKAAQIIGSLAHLTEKRDIVTHLPILVTGLRAASVDPVPATRATASKALGSLVEKLGEDAFPDLIPSLMSSLRTDTGAGDRLGSAQALSEVLAGLGTGRLEETLPTILQNVASSRAAVREGFMTLFIYLPACFGNAFANYLSQIVPSILSGLADDIEAIRDIALRAGRLLVKNFATKSIDLLLPELQRGLADDSYRIRLSSVELVGDLLFNLTGISSKTEADEEDESAIQAGQSLLEVLGEERRNKVLSSLYICRCDTSGLVRTASIAVWKALVATPRTLRELIPTLTQMIISRLASSNMEQKHIAGNALGEVIRKAGESIFATLLPSLEDGLQTSTDPDHRQGICIALREVVNAAQPESLEDHEKKLIAIVRLALVDSNVNVREAAAESFDALQQVFGKRAVDQVLPYLLNLLRSDDNAENALSALLTLLTEQMRANTILPNLIPTLLTNPITTFNARALASLADVGGSAMNRRLPAILNGLCDNIVACQDEERETELNAAFDAVLSSVDEFDGLNIAMSVMLAMIKHDDHRKRAVAATHLAAFFSETDVDYSRYNQDLIRVLLISFDDRDKDVVAAALAALGALQSHLRKEEMETLAASTRQVLQQVGTPGSNLPGFSLPKGILPVLQIFLQGLMNGTAEQRLHAANGISDIIDKSAPESLKPFVTQITGPLIRVVGERSVEVKSAIIFALNQLLEKIPTFLRPFLPQLQRTFTKCIADPSSDILRTRAIKALSTLITLTPRIDPLIAELVTGAKTTDSAVRNAMLKALQEVVSKVGGNMSEGSRDAILGLMDATTAEQDDMMVTMARLLGAMIKVLPASTAAGLIKNRVLVQPSTNASILALNAVLAESAKTLTTEYLSETRNVVLTGFDKSTYVQHNSVLAIGKLMLTEKIIDDHEANKPIFDSLASKVKPGNDIDTRRLILVVIRTLARHFNTDMRPSIPVLVQPIYASVRDPVIPIKLAAEATFLQLFDVVDSESEVFDAFMQNPLAKEMYPPQVLKGFSDYFKRIALKLGAQRREQREAEGGAGGLGLASDEMEDEREVWSVGKVDLGENAFNGD